MIANQSELRKAVDNAGSLLQQITDFVKLNGASEKIRFPRRYIRTADSSQQKLSFIKNKELEKTLSYNIIFIDILRWLLNCTDINYTAKEMLIKYCVLAVGSICESIIIGATKGKIGKNHNFKNRTKRMVEKGMIQQTLKDDLDWLWDKRSDGTHPYLLVFSEIDLYKQRDYKKAYSAMQKLISVLSSQT